MRLCFGTFASILCWGKIKTITERILVGTMTQTVDQNCSYIKNGPAVSKLLSCTQNLSDGRSRWKDGESFPPLSKVIEEARKAEKKDVIQKFKNRVVPLIDKDKKVQVIFALRDLIRDDNTIDNENKEKFMHHLDGMTKKDVLIQCELEENTSVFPNILAGIFLYTVIAVQNTVGKEYVERVGKYIDRYDGFNYNSNTFENNNKIFSVPISVSEHFSGRFDYLIKLKDKFSNSATNAANKPIKQTICGLGGFGKTQLALKYAFDSFKENKYETVCWVECVSEDAIKKSCNDFLSKANETTTADIVSRFTHWFQINNNWLLIFDDVNENDTPIEYMIPKIGKGNIIITSRVQPNQGIFINLECMDEKEATAFLIKRTRTGINDTINAEKTAVRLGCLPLALEQAAAYIYETRKNFADYLDLINKYDLKVFDNDERVKNYNWNVHTVWNITLKKLSDNSKKLLYCFAYMSAENLEIDWLTEHAWKLKIERETPDLLLTQRGKNGKPTGKQINVSEKFRKFTKESKFDPELIAVLTDELALEKAIRELRNFSLISSKVDKSFTMHVLLQEVIRNSISDTSYLFSVWEVLQARCNYTDLIYKDYRINLSLPQAKSLVHNIEMFLKYHKELVETLNKDNSYAISIDMKILEFQFYSFLAQYLTLLGDNNGDKSIYEAADKCYEKSCDLALFLFGGGENDIVSSNNNFTLIQEKHRRMRVNLILKRNDIAKKLYEEVKNVLQNSITVNQGMVEQAFLNYDNLCYEFDL